MYSQSVSLRQRNNNNIQVSWEVIHRILLQNHVQEFIENGVSRSNPIFM